MALIEIRDDEWQAMEAARKRREAARKARLPARPVVVLREEAPPIAKQEAVVLNFAPATDYNPARAAARIYPVPIGPSRPLPADEPSPKIKLRTIIVIVAHVYDVPLNCILSPRRAQIITRPRQEAMWLCKKYTNHSLPEIGRAFGGRDHTTVLHAIRKIDALIAGEGYQARADSYVADWLAYVAERNRMSPPPPPPPPPAPRRNPKRKVWTDEKLAVLRALLSDGKTMLQAAKIMGCKYDAVCKAVFRHITLKGGRRDA